MSTKHISSVKILQRTKDDFTRIHGIGPVTEKRLRGEGIYTYSQLAKLSAQAIHSLVPNFSENQIHKQDWIGQARKLAHSEKKQDHKKKNVTPIACQHYENFTLEFLLDEKNKVRRVRAIHVQSGDKDTWSNWDAERLIAFLAWHTGARLPHGKPTIPAALKPVTVIHSTTQPAQLLDVISHSSSQPPPTPVLTEMVEPKIIHPASIPSLSKIRLLEWKTLLANTDQSIRSLSQDRDFDVRLKLDISKASRSNCSQLDITGRLYAKKLGGGTRQIINEGQWIVPFSPIIDITINDTRLPQGIYRLEASIHISFAEAASFPIGADAFFQGGLFQVY